MMNELSTPTPMIEAAEAVALSRRQICLLALVVCVPVPLLTYAAGTIPLPEMLKRVAASFAPLFAPLETSDVRRTRADSSVEPLAIRYLPSRVGAEAELAAPPAHDTVAGRATASRRRQSIARAAEDGPSQTSGGDTTTAADPNPTPQEPSTPPDAPQPLPPGRPDAGPDTSAPDSPPSTPSPGTPTGHGGGGGAGAGGSGQGSQGGGSGGAAGTPSTGNGSGGSPPVSPPAQGPGETPPASGDRGSSGGAGGGGSATPGSGGGGASGGGGGRP